MRRQHVRLIFKFTLYFVHCLWIMDSDEQFFSPQALRLLAADNDADPSAFEDSLCLFVDHSSVMQHHPQQRPPPKSRSIVRGLPGTSTFRVASNVEPKPKRGKFEPERRMEVAHIRKRGACLRCRIMKLAVSFYLLGHASKSLMILDSAREKCPAKTVLVVRILVAHASQSIDGWTACHSL